MSIMSEMEGKFVEMFGQPFKVIDVYTRAQAIEDGVLIDVSPLALGEHGFLYPVAVTERIWAEVVIPPGEVATWQDDLGRLNDLLTCLRYGIKKSPNPSTEITFQMDVMNNDREPTKTITLKATCGPGDNLEPVITVMFPDED